MAVQAGATHLEKSKGGMGVLLRGQHEAVALALGYNFVSADTLLNSRLTPGRP